MGLRKVGFSVGHTWRHPSDYQALHSVAAAIYLVDPASSHMLVSKIKPCMSKYKL